MGISASISLTWVDRRQVDPSSGLPSELLLVFVEGAGFPDTQVRPYKGGNLRSFGLALWDSGLGFELTPL